MSALSVCAAGVVASLLAVILKKQNAEYSVILTICACSLIVTCIIGYVIDAVSGIKEIFTASSMDSSYLTLLLKCVGICFLTEFSCDCCKDAGQMSLSNIVLFSGRIFVLVSALPLFTELLSMVSQLCGG